MTDSLEHARLVTRTKAGRRVALRLTEGGTRAAQDVLARRGDLLRELVDRLPPAQRAALTTGLTGLLDVLYTEVRSSDRICRLCDRAACVRAGATCPVGAAERAAHGA